MLWIKLCHHQFVYQSKIYRCNSKSLFNDEQVDSFVSNSEMCNFVDVWVLFPLMQTCVHCETIQTKIELSAH